MLRKETLGSDCPKEGASGGVRIMDGLHPETDRNPHVP